MKKLIVALFLAVGQQGMAQGTVVVKSFRLYPENQWFVFKGRRYSGVSVYVGKPSYVRNEVERLLEYYGDDPDRYENSNYESEYIINLSNGYNVIINVSEIDPIDRTKTIFIRVK